MTSSTSTSQPAARSRRAREALRIFCRNIPALVGLVLCVFIVGAAVFGPSVYQVEPFETVAAPLLAPGEEGAPLLGTDYLGRDLLAGLIHGARATLLVGVFATLIAMLLGVVVGALAGYYGNRVDRMLMRLTEFFQVMPPVLLAMVLIVLLKPTLLVQAVAIGAASWTSAARLTRGEFMRIRHLDYVAAARTMGASDGYLIWRVILPAALPPLVISATLTIGAAILFESGLSFLGLSNQNVMSWGLMIGGNRPYMLDAWWATTLPGMAIFTAVLAISLVGDGLNEVLNPRLRQR
ncbi:ABC transporter permease [Variovorax sp. PAMC 28711]|nr:ABC transporter permease [Variovorax sp. PAMC 28711]